MGCDIHPYLEYRKPGFPLWWGWQVGIDRNYDLFRAMGLEQRGSPEIKPVVSIRGLPLDLSYECEQGWERWKADAHNPSWLTFLEFNAALRASHPSHSKQTASVTAKIIAIAMFEFVSQGYEVRLVFWWDN